MSISSDELRKLSVVERPELIDAIWESIGDEPDSLPITDAQRRELDRRLDRAEAVEEVRELADQLSARVDPA